MICPVSDILPTIVHNVQIDINVEFISPSVPEITLFVIWGRYCVHEIPEFAKEPRR
jgi:hypothetical protein